MKRTLGIRKGNMATADDFTAPVYEVSLHELKIGLFIRDVARLR